ncbi:hypothetical protein BDQ17DRAFT_770017 [Cyathus striatus]|nr:hypothetical protein BDQ17DRAFT_770017 [Cyathus striatus]
MNSSLETRPLRAFIETFPLVYYVPAGIVHRGRIFLPDALPVSLDADLGGCHICLDDFQDPKNIYDSSEPEYFYLRQLPCKHVFHRTCIDDYLLSGASMSHRCPVCRKDVIPYKLRRRLSDESIPPYQLPLSVRPVSPSPTGPSEYAIPHVPRRRRRIDSPHPGPFPIVAAWRDELRRRFSEGLLPIPVPSTPTWLNEADVMIPDERRRRFREEAPPRPQLMLRRELSDDSTSWSLISPETINEQGSSGNNLRNRFKFKHTRHKIRTTYRNIMKGLQILTLSSD